MNRRGFLRGALGVAVGGVIGAELVEALAPKRTIFLPPRGGWWSSTHGFVPTVYELQTAIGAQLDALVRSREPIYYNEEGMAEVEARIHAALVRKIGETDAELRARLMASKRFNVTLEIPGMKPIACDGFYSDTVFVG